MNILLKVIFLLFLVTNIGCKFERINAIKMVVDGKKIKINSQGFFITNNNTLKDKNEILIMDNNDPKYSFDLYFICQNIENLEKDYPILFSSEDISLNIFLKNIQKNYLMYDCMEDNSILVITKIKNKKISGFFKGSLCDSEGKKIEMKGKIFSLYLKEDQWILK